ncbi:MAG: murein hydrolase activator EnvC family protein [Ilumatobacteraceae bacterium]
MASLVASVLGIVPGEAVAAWAGDVPCLVMPALGDIVEPFVEPPCPYCAGRRGIVVRTAGGAPVGASAPGTVTFAGPVAGTNYVVVAHGGGWRTTYGRLAAVRVRAGQRVPLLAVVGTSGGCLHFGVRQGDAYVDPQPLLVRPPARARLVPADGRPARRPAAGMGRGACPPAPTPGHGGAASPARR